MEAPKHMERISFLDGQILHDFHLNNMQRNIAESVKVNATKERYDILMLVSPYNFYFAEPFVNTKYRHQSSTANLNTLTFSINQDQWITPVMELPESTNEMYLYAEYVDNPEDKSFVDFYYRTGEGNNWIKVDVDTPIYMPATKYIQLRIDCKYEGTTRPTIYDFAAMFK
ncbi:hypothetical protein [Oceanobacillus profundus]|uniref:Uncharacterized protein n=1 Tax=Oceanobacillus profundus TaxID=372463 RepID=A0A417YGW7_9BACI|nr:hypothetical protein [Oceanobacillus profundus]MBR2246172.1 hypothetical protein [Bacilli bacterium]MBR3119842.1 hypothetical protein [Oceanobacillus sp.]RHW31986.1 hypothetical protein D1B32_12170 [Oceanobacillus profundus]